MDGFIGEIRLFPYTFVPEGWLPCLGQALLIQQYQALATIIGNFYGAMTQTQFYLPNLQAATAMGWGTGPGLTQRVIGTHVGSENVTLTTPFMANHTHVFNGSFETSTEPLIPGPVANTSWFTFPQTDATTTALSANAYLTNGSPPNRLLAPGTVTSAGGGTAHENRQPYLAFGYFICNYGVYPVRP